MVGKMTPFTTHPMTARVPWLLISLCVALTLRSVACEDTTSQPTDNFDRQALLASVATSVILPRIIEFETKATALSSATSDYAIAVSNQATDIAVKRQSAQTAWKSAMATWQRLEVMQIGPAGDPGTFTAGQNIRDDIYSWPTVSTCSVDQEIVAANFSDNNFFDTKLVNVYGLDAIEYLLFYTLGDNTCPSQVAINAGPWDAITPDELDTRRANYANVAAQRLAEDATRLQQAWEPNGDNFAGKIQLLTGSNSPYQSLSQAIDELFAAMFYLDLSTKDAKLAVPAGLLSTCSLPPCLEERESLWANHSKENILSNLLGIQTIFLGGSDSSDVGFDDFLVELGASSLALTLQQDIENAIAAVEDIPSTLEEALTNDLSSVTIAHDAIRKVTTSFKEDFSIVLRLTIPQEGAGDND